MLEEETMSRSKINVPEAKQAMDNFKMEAAREVGVDLNNFTPVGFESVRERINIQQSTQTNVLRWVK